MKLQLDLPGIVRVRDTNDYKGNPVTVVSVLGIDVAYYIGKSDDYFRNEDWEEVFNRQIARFLGNIFVQQYMTDWSRDNPTGREVTDESVIILEEVRED